MRLQPSLAQAQALGAGHRRVPVAAVFPTGRLTPADCFRRLRQISRHCFVLESRQTTATSGRHTFLGFDPILELTCQDGRLTISNGGERQQQTTTDPGDHIRQVLADHSSPKVAGLPPFTGGLVGYFAYDYIRYAEPCIDLGRQDVEGFHDVDLMLFDKVVAFDHQARTISLIFNLETEHLARDYAGALTEAERLRRRLEQGPKTEPERLRLASGWRPLFDQSDWTKLVLQAQEHIAQGDIFQVVLSNRLECEASGDLFQSYQLMGRANPSPYMFYLASDDVQIAGAAPETLVRLRGDRVETFPLAGTRGRGGTAAADRKLKQELLNDAKERAEHNMLVDLGRNDIGRIARFGSVEVVDHLSVVRFSHVMHLASLVRGRLRPGLDAVDAITALLPAGTLSGAPKIRACQIIGQLEGARRGIYGGAVGYLGLNGDLDTCIAIRLAFQKNGRVFVRSGAGIVADSRPESEYAECRRKLAAVIEAVEKAGRP
ncbi:MAG: anthranilate synthase component I family protein [Propionibacteriaceae bacterium]|jgi:anthranilate synthase component 1|nr:anthranilate synthase component I family protein [Propionibacteriaceae bacterium]